MIHRKSCAFLFFSFAPTTEQMPSDVNAASSAASWQNVLTIYNNEASAYCATYAAQNWPEARRHQEAIILGMQIFDRAAMERPEVAPERDQIFAIARRALENREHPWDNPLQQPAYVLPVAPPVANQ